jgi:hypothetical protein
MPQHRKVAPRSDAAFRLHFTAMCWCVEQLTDGQVPLDVPATLTAAPQGKRLKAAIEELLSSGLWDRTDTHYVIHDFLDWNPSAEVVRANREAARQRMSQLRSNRTDKNPPRSSQNVRANNSEQFNSDTDTDTDTDTEPEKNIQPDTSNQRPVRLVPSEPPPPPPPPVDFTDAERITLCPPDLHERARKLGVIAELANALKVDPDSLFAEAEDYVQHQVLTEQKPGSRWMTRLRGQLRRKARAGLLPAPGAVEHAKRKAETPIPKGWRPQPGVPGWFIDERGFSHPDPRKAS